MSNPAFGQEPLRMEVSVSRPVLRALEEPQVLYALAVILPAQQTEDTPPPPLSFCLVLDRSTSMAGERLDTARQSAENIISQLRPQDRIAMITFSDRAEVLISSESTVTLPEARKRLYSIQASGGTEIYQGLLTGVNQLRASRRSGAVDHLVLLTDGRTYGDESSSLQLAQDAAEEGIEITALGIGDEWNDSFLDTLAAKTGGQAVYIDNLSALGPFLQQKFRGLGQTHADQIVVEVETTPGVTKPSAFRIHPAPLPLHDANVLRLGSLYSGSTLSLLLEFLIPPLPAMDSFEISRLHLSAHLAKQSTNLRTVLSLSLPVVNEPVAAPIPGSLLTAVRHSTLARLEEQASQDVQNGQLKLATTRLDRLATRLFELGETDLANAVLAESAQVQHTHQLTDKGKKVVKYGTRNLLDSKRRLAQ